MANDKQIALSELTSLVGGKDDLDIYTTVQRARDIIRAAKLCTVANEQVNSAQRDLDEAKRRQEVANLKFGELIATAK